MAHPESTPTSGLHWANESTFGPYHADEAEAIIREARANCIASIQSLWPESFLGLTIEDERAMALFAQHLTEEQRWEFEQYDSFHVLCQSGRRYIVWPSGRGVYLVDDEDMLAKYCLQAVERVPKGDWALSVLFLLQSNEWRFLLDAVETTWAQVESWPRKYRRGRWRLSLWRMLNPPVLVHILTTASSLATVLIGVVLKDAMLAFVGYAVFVAVVLMPIALANHIVRRR